MATNLAHDTLTERREADAPRHPASYARRITDCGGRQALLAIGWINVFLGLVGLVVPVMPTTVFLLIAAWAFSRSSDRFHSWLYNHAILGPPIRDWHQHRIIPARAKMLALSMMAASLALLIHIGDGNWILPGSVALCLIPIAWFIVTRPSRSATI